MHNSFGRENKKIKVSGTSRNNFIEINPIFQKRIHTYTVEWGTKSYFETESIDISDSNDEGSDKAGSITPDIEAVSDTSQPPVKPASAKVTKAERPSWKFQKKSSTEWKKTQNVAKEAEMVLIQSLVLPRTVEVRKRKRIKMKYLVI